MSLRKWTIAWLFLLASLSGPFPGTTTAEETLSQIALANDYFQKSQYRQAADIYQKLIDRKMENGYLYYNLGNTYLRLGKTGPSILSYIRAKKFLPRYEPLDANLRYALLKTRDQLELPSTSGVGSFFFWVHNFTKAEHLAFLAIINLAFWLTLGAWVWKRNGFWDLTRKILLALLLISAVSVGVKYFYESETSTGVILADTLAVKSAGGENNVTLFQLHEGSVVAIIGTDNGWYHIRLNDGNKGWVPKESIGT